MIFPCVHSNRRREPQVANAAPAFISQLSFNVSASSFSSILRITEAKLAKRTLLPADLCSCYLPMPRFEFSRAACRNRARPRSRARSCVRGRMQADREHPERRRPAGRRSGNGKPGRAGMGEIVAQGNNVN